ncbi:MAG TPA: PLP-dependent aminotransferase family protein [Candidatus Udaeobacter sp.]|nr:PLP-dependent aminotransferase family protein [Candidatus Udaeobacter sp.]
MKSNGAIHGRTGSSVPRQRRRRLVMSFEMVRLDRAASEPLYQQLYRQIRTELESGSFDSSASRVPSSRVLATTLGISRPTVNQAFSKLLEEGYLQVRKRSGMFVADHLPATFLKAARLATIARSEHSPRVARRVTRMADFRSGRQLDVGIGGPPSVTFVAGLPAVDEFPIAVWERLRAQVLAKKGAHLLRYASSRGEVELRKAIAAYLCDFRGANCHPDQIVVVGGMQQAILACALALINQGEAAWIEDPGFLQARNALAFVGAKLVPRPIDREGLVIGRCSRQNSPRLVFVTPSHQFPFGVTMSLKRRRALIEFAESRDGYILEDDYNSEFRFDGPPLPCLQGLDNAGRVIYAGTMSKILYPSLRLGFLIAPPQLVDTLVKVRAIMDQHSPAIDQATLARFITEGFFLSHVKRIRELYAQRRLFFIEQFQKWLGDCFDLEITPAGLHFVAWLRRKEDFPVFMRAREQTDVWPRPLSFFCIKAQLDPAFVFGFAAWSQAQIEQGLAKLASAAKQLKQRGAGNGSSFQIQPFSPATSPYWPLRAIRSD